MRRKTGGKGGRRNKRGRKKKENEEGEEIVIFVSGSLCVKISSNPRLPCQVSIMLRGRILVLTVHVGYVNSDIMSL